MSGCHLHRVKPEPSHLKTKSDSLNDVELSTELIQFCGLHILAVCGEPNFPEHVTFSTCVHFDSFVCLHSFGSRL